MASIEENTASAGTEDMVIGFKVNGASHTLKHREGAQYEPLTLGEYLAAVRNPNLSPAAKDADDQSHIEAKGTQTALVPSAYRGHDARNGRAQEKNNGKYLALVLDVDGGLADPLEAAKSILGDVHMVAHNTYSDNQPGKGRRERLVIPLATPLSSLGYPAFITALNEQFTQTGCIMDPSASNKTQLAYFGMLGPWTDGPRVRVNEGPLLDLRQYPDLMARAEELRAATPVSEGKKYGSPRWTANLQLDSETILLHFGCEPVSHDRLRFPNQTGENGVQLFDDGGWSAWSETAEKVLGRKHGDALDLFRAYTGLTDEQITDIAKVTVLGYQIPPVQFWQEYGAAIHTEAVEYRQWFTDLGKKQIEHWFLHDPKFREFVPATERAKLMLTTSAPIFKLSKGNKNRKPAKMEYLVENWLPKGIVVGHYGKGGGGKSSWVSTHCASISAQYGTLWITSEEDEDWVTTRFIESGGHEDAILTSSHMPEKIETGEVEVFDVYAHLEKVMQQAQQEFGAERPLGVVVLDAIGSLVTWGNGESGNHDGGVKRLLAHLHTLAKKYEVTIAIIGHTNKRSSLRDGADAVTGARAWTTSTRRSYIFDKDDHAETDYENIVQVAKNNTGTIFGAKFKTVPVFTLYPPKAAVGDDPGHPGDYLCRTEIIGGVIVGDRAMRELMNDDGEDEKLGKQQQRKAKNQAVVDAVVNAIRDNDCHTREEITAHVAATGMTLHPYHWVNFLDERLEKEHGIVKSRNLHNTYEYH